MVTTSPLPSFWTAPTLLSSAKSSRSRYTSQARSTVLGQLSQPERRTHPNQRPQQLRRWPLGLQRQPRGAPDGKFEIVQRHGFIAIADTVCGPYKVQKPTWTYPEANTPNLQQHLPEADLDPGCNQPNLRLGGGSTHLVQWRRLPRHLFGIRRSRRLARVFDRRPHQLEGRGHRLDTEGVPEDILLRGKHDVYGVVQDGAARRGSGRRPPHPYHLGRVRCGQGQPDTGRIKSRQQGHRVTVRRSDVRQRLWCRRERCWSGWDWRKQWNWRR